MHYFQPTELDIALQFLAENKSKVIAGGTDVFPSSPQGKVPRELLDIGSISEIRNISFDEQHISIGAAVSWSEIVREPLPDAFRALKQAALQVGSIQIQNSGTIGGNICNASPAADGVPPLLALDASVEIASAKNGTRVVRISDFILNIRKTDLSADELVTAIIVPRPKPNARSAFEKLGSRKYLVISISMVAAVISCRDNGVIEHAAIAVGACSPVAQRLHALEADMIGKAVENIDITPQHLSVLSPIDDVRGTSGYRLDVVAEQCKRAIMNAVAL